MSLNVGYEVIGKKGEQGEEGNSDLQHAGLSRGECMDRQKEMLGYSDIIISTIILFL